jgi:membrane-bound lytic murein transglycosylase D
MTRIFNIASRQILNIVCISSLLGIASCARLVKQIESPKMASNTASKSVEKTSEETLKSDNIVLSKQAAKLATELKDDHRIMGSAKIETPAVHGTKTFFLYGAEHLKLENYYFDIPVVYNKAVKKWINYFLKRGRGFFERYSARAGVYAPILGKILSNYDMPRDLIFLAMAESGFQTGAKSWAKAVGPWQFMPYTGKRYGLKIDWYRDERRDPIKATIAAAKYLRKLYGDFGSWELAAAAYNAGEGKVGRAIRRYRTENFWDLRKGRYLKSETKNYVPKIMALAIIGKNLKSFGFEDIDFHEPLDFEEIDLNPMTDLFKVAEVLNVDFMEIQRLNPEILRWFTPPNIETYKLRIPVGKAKAWRKCCFDRNYLAKDFQEYRVRGSRTSLADVSRKFKIKDKNVLAGLNRMGKSSRLRKNSTIYLPFKVGQSKKAYMYADLYEKPRRSVIRRRKYKRLIRTAKRKGRRITTPSIYYTVKKGDSLWSVSRKSGTSLYTIIASNMRIIKRRQIRAGDRLVVK